MCPLSVLQSWVDEAKRWTPGLKILKYHGLEAQRKLVRAALAKSLPGRGHQDSSSADDEPAVVDVLVTTYDMITADKDWFRRFCVWRCIVLDEGHRIKNNQTKHAQSLQRLRSDYRLVLTGLVFPRSLPLGGLYTDFCFQRTPVQNDLSEVWSILNWLFPDYLLRAPQYLSKKLSS